MMVGKFIQTGGYVNKSLSSPRKVDRTGMLVGQIIRLLCWAGMLII